MRIIGIDPGTGLLGFGVIDAGKDGKCELVDGGVIKTPVKEDDAVRLQTIFEELTEDCGIYAIANQTGADRLRPGRQKTDAGNGARSAWPQRSAKAGRLRRRPRLCNNAFNEQKNFLKCTIEKA